MVTVQEWKGDCPGELGPLSFSCHHLRVEKTSHLQMGPCLRAGGRPLNGIWTERWGAVSVSFAPGFHHNAACPPFLMELWPRSGVTSPCCLGLLLSEITEGCPAVWVDKLCPKIDCKYQLSRVQGSCDLIWRCTRLNACH